MNWFEQHAYLAAWLALPIALVPSLFGKMKGKPINSTKLLLQAAFVFCLAAVFTPVFEQPARMFAAGFAFFLLIFMLILEENDAERAHRSELKPNKPSPAQTTTQPSGQPTLSQPPGLPSPEQSENKAGKRLFITLAPKELTGFYRQGHTSIQARKLAEPYLGKWLKLSGTVSDIQETVVAGKGFVTLKEFTVINDEAVMLFFSKQWIERLSTVRPGDRIDVIGKVDTIDASTITLQDCEIV